MRVSELKAQMDEQFQRVDERFERVDEQFRRVDERFEEVDRQFGELRELVVSEGEATRRHFDIVAEQMRAERDVLIDAVKASTDRLLGLTATNAADHVADGGREAP